MPNFPLRVSRFGINDPLTELKATTQVRYLQSYLADLEATTVVHEPRYFDRDYLAEFSAFYSTSARGYPNLCERAHFFRAPAFTRRLLRSAAAGNDRAVKRLQDSYLGFVVIRPIPAARLGRTVLRWYTEIKPLTPRITKPEREYTVHVAGIELSVFGLAWQQQDTGVGACATVGVWSMLHSSAFDDHHAVPTTAEVTQAAHMQASLGSRVFPSDGLTTYQICEAVKAQNLAPVRLDGDVTDKDGYVVLGFDRERFSASCASFIRSGYPVLIIGSRGGEGHAVCAVGFRSSSGNSSLSPGQVGLQDEGVPHIYLHDDNIGPNVKFRIDTETVRISKKKKAERVVLEPEAPTPIASNHFEQPNLSNMAFVPEHLVVGVHNDLRTSPDALHEAGLVLWSELAPLLAVIARRHGVAPPALILSTQFVKLADYLGDELRQAIGHNKRILSRVRLELAERAPAMSLHLGVVRIGAPGSILLLDVLFDTTDSDRNHPVFATIVYQRAMRPPVEVLHTSKQIDFGEIVSGF